MAERPPGSGEPRGDDVDRAPDTDPAFRRVSERVVHRGYVMTVAEVTFAGPGGEPFTRDVVSTSGAVAVVALDERTRPAQVVFVRQFRAPIERYLLEIPAGLRDVEGEAPERTAARELVEEAGLAAGRLERLGSYLAAAGMTNQRTELYLARDLRDVETESDGVEEDYMTIERLSLDDAWAMVVDGRIDDAKTIVGLTLARERLATDAG